MSKKCLKWKYHVHTSERLCTMSSITNSVRLNATKMYETLGICTDYYDTTKVYSRKFKARYFDVEDKPHSDLPI